MLPTLGSMPCHGAIALKSKGCGGTGSLIHSGRWGWGEVDDGERRVRQDALFYEFSLEEHVPEGHLLRSIDRFVELDG